MLIFLPSSTVLALMYKIFEPIGGTRENEEGDNLNKQLIYTLPGEAHEINMAGTLGVSLGRQNQDSNRSLHNRQSHGALQGRGNRV